MHLGIGFQIFMGDSQAHDRPSRFDIEGDAGVLVLVIGFKGTIPGQNEASRRNAFDNLPDYVDRAAFVRFPFMVSSLLYPYISPAVAGMVAPLCCRIRDRGCGLIEKTAFSSNTWI